MSYHVIGTRVQQGQNSVPQITHIAYEGPLLSPKVIISIEEAITRIVAKRTEFYVNGANQQYVIRIVKHRYGKSSIQAGPINGRDYLLELQRC